MKPLCNRYALRYVSRTLTATTGNGGYMAGILHHVGIRHGWDCQQQRLSPCCQ
ncbi:MAG: hypothetical protein QM610_12330 [Chitinophagaceae bacterium]